MSARLQPPESWIYRMAMEGGFLTLRDVGVFPWFGHNVIFPDLPPWPTYSIPTFTIYFGSIFVTSILAYTWYQHDARLDNEEVKEALELRAMLLGSATIPTPGEAEKMRKLTGKLTMRTDPGIAQPAPRTTLSPASLTDQLVIASLLKRADACFKSNRVAEAILCWREAAIRAETIVGSAHPDTIRALSNLANALLRTDNMHDAYLYLLKIGAVAERAHGVPPEVLGDALAELAQVSRRLNEDEQAESAARRSLAFLHKAGVTDPTRLGSVLFLHAAALAQLARADEALRVLAQAEAQLEVEASYLLPPELLTTARLTHAALLLDSASPDAAAYVTALREELESYSPLVAWRPLRELACLLWARGDAATALRIGATALATGAEVMELVADRVALLYEAGREREAGEWAAYLVAMMRLLKRRLLRARRQRWRPHVRRTARPEDDASESDDAADLPPPPANEAATRARNEADEYVEGERRRVEAQGRAAAVEERLRERVRRGRVRDVDAERRAIGAEIAAEEHARRVAARRDTERRPPVPPHECHRVHEPLPNLAEIVNGPEHVPDLRRPRAAAAKAAKAAAVPRAASAEAATAVGEAAGRSAGEGFRVWHALGVSLRAWDAQFAVLKAELRKAGRERRAAPFQPAYWSLARFAPPLAACRYAAVTEAVVRHERRLVLRVALHAKAAPAGQRALHLPLPCTLSVCVPHPLTGAEVRLEQRLEAHMTRTREVLFTTDELPFRAGGLYAADVRLTGDAGEARGRMLQVFYAATEEELAAARTEPRPPPRREEDEEWRRRHPLAAARWDRRRQEAEAAEEELGPVSDDEEDQEADEEVAAILRADAKAKRAGRAQATSGEGRGGQADGEEDQEADEEEADEEEADEEEADEESRRRKEKAAEYLRKLLARERAKRDERLPELDRRCGACCSGGRRRWRGRTSASRRSWRRWRRRHAS